MKKWIWGLLRRLRWAGIVQLSLKSGLTEDGWFRAFHAQQSIDRQGNPLPWFNYAFIKWLAPRLRKDMHLFEYGSGNSTRWFAERVASITSVEHDAAWVARLSPCLPPNAQVIARPLDNKAAYVGEVGKAGRMYDMIIVDGRERNLCVEACLPYLSKGGVLILDNSERENYLPARQRLEAEGFRCLDFWGMPVGAAHNSCTSLYYRNQNILNI